MSTTYHVCLDVRGTIRSGDWRNWVGSCTDKETGRVLTPDEVFDWLFQAILDGKQVVPLCDCDNFDFQKGCLGHPSEAT